MQKLDDEIGRCKELQDVLPAQLNNLIGDVESAQAKVFQTETARAAIQKKQKDLEADIKHNVDLSRKYGGQLADIKTNKEYKALNGEIANLQQKNSEIELQMIDLMETDSEMKKQLAIDNEALKIAEGRKAEKESDLRAQIDELESKIETVRNQRNELARQLPLQLVKQYGNLIKFKHNKAVAYNLNGACDGCGFIIRPQIRIDLDLRKKIIICESCGRILLERFNDI